MRSKKTAYLIGKRIFDCFSASLGLLLLFPLFAGVALWVKRDSPGPVFFRQERVGKNGKLFRIFKFRTMRDAPQQKGLEITPSNDDRITKSGCFLRKYKIDELPQLINVVKGEMSLVGPRPEVSYYMSFYPAEKRRIILSVLPGITDIASLQFKDEGDWLQKAEDPESTYIKEILPLKLTLACDYVGNASFCVDLKIICKTLISILK